MSVEIDSSSIDSLIAKYAKLNELNEQQLDTVKELLKEGIDQGVLIGEVDGAIRTAEEYNSITQKLVLARTLTASMTAIVLTYPFTLITGNIFLIILGTAIANTLIFYSVDIFAKLIKSRLDKKANNSV